MSSVEFESRVYERGVVALGLMQHFQEMEELRRRNRGAADRGTLRGTEVTLASTIRRLGDGRPVRPKQLPDPILVLSQRGQIL